MDHSMIQIQVIIDLIRIWSYLTYFSLERATKTYRAEGGQVAITSNPFQVQPEAASSGILKSDELARELGSGEAARNALARVGVIAKERNTPLAYERAVSANTQNAHILVTAAGRAGLAGEAVHLLLRAHFVDGLDISDEQVLAGVADTIRVAPPTPGDALITDDGLARVRASGVTTVPRIVMQDTAHCTGLQEESELLDAMKLSTPRSYLMRS